MSLKLSSPIEQKFVLSKTDRLFKNEGEPTTISVRQATQGQQEQRARVFAEISRVIENENIFGTASMAIRQSWSMEELKRVEVYLTLSACNIRDIDDNPLFRFQNGKLIMDESDFRDAWYQLPPSVADEIHEKVLEVNLMWSGLGEAS